MLHKKYTGTNNISEARTEGNTFDFPVTYNISLQLCELKNLLEKKRCCLDIFVMTQMDLPGKQATVEHCSAPG